MTDIGHPAAGHRPLDVSPDVKDTLPLHAEDVHHLLLADARAQVGALSSRETITLLLQRRGVERLGLEPVGGANTSFISGRITLSLERWSSLCATLAPTTARKHTMLTTMMTT